MLKANKLLYALLRSGELIVLDLAENPGDSGHKEWGELI